MLPMHVAIRVDAARTIGTGHVARCSALAQELSRRNHKITFICRDLPGANLTALRNQFPVVTLPAPAKYNEELSHLEGRPLYAAWLGVDWRIDAKETRAALASAGTSGFDWLIVDHYGLDGDWERELRKDVDHILTVDDLADRKLTSDIVLNQNLMLADSLGYEPWVGGDTQLLLGPKYALLRAEFRQAREKIERSATAREKIFVGFGGVDAQGDTLKTCRALRGLSDSEIIAVVGNAFSGMDTLEAEQKQNPRLQIFRGVNHVAQLLSECKLAIGGGGTMSWERACLGLPAIVVAISENQEPIADALANAGACIYLGRNSSNYEDRLKKSFQDLQSDTTLFSKMKQTALGLVDGLGTSRAADTMEEISG